VRPALPENRLVARTLERRWEEALEEVRRLEEDYARFRRRQPATLTQREVDQIRALAQDLPALWHAPTTTAADRQQIIRFLVQRVAVDLDGNSNRVRVTLTWVGDHTSAHEVARPVLRYEQAADFPRLLARIRDLWAAGLSLAGIAERLNAEGYRPVKGAERFHGALVGRILRRRAPDRGPRARRGRGQVQKDEWLVVELSAQLGIPKNTLHAWMRRGWVHYRRLEGYRAPCLCWADASELRRLRRLSQTPRGWWDPPLPAELTTPRRPPGA
jgi:DNA-binding transcriptional MerR regulator